MDFFLVGVIPGKGLNGPIFLQLGSASSCGYEHWEESTYSEFFPELLGKGNKPLLYVKPDGGNNNSISTTPAWNIDMTVGASDYAVNAELGITVPVCDTTFIPNNAALFGLGGTEAQSWTYTSNHSTPLAGGGWQAVMTAAMAGAYAATGIKAGAKGNFSGIGYTVAVAAAAFAGLGVDAIAEAIWQEEIAINPDYNFLGQCSSPLLRIA